jgi:2-dehydro-3-deoxyphosphogluconate aldolase/(4S)-4-hydroxy-2-oxoglutarate aldolase
MSRMTKAAARARIEEIGLIPAVRSASADDALFAAETLYQAGVPIVELAITTPGVLDLMARLLREHPDFVVGAGDVLDVDAARQALKAGARFVSSPVFEPRIVRLTVRAHVIAVPGALTPTEITAAWQMGADLVKVFPCMPAGGDAYLRALRAPLAQVPLVAAGGVTQQTAGSLVLAGAVALGIGKELIPRAAVERRQTEWIAELARRFSTLVREARQQRAFD